MLGEILDDICARFLVNLPREELDSSSRLGFQLEQAFWFYEDFYRSSKPESLPKLTLKSFCAKLLQHCPVKFPQLGGGEGVTALIDEFYQYKAHVPTCGGIILNESLEKCLVVRGFSAKSTWGFPKGKIAKDELPSACAIREVLEETGFDISNIIQEEYFLQVENNEQPIRLYIIPGVSEKTHFEPQTRREIRDIQWHQIKDIGYEKSGPNRYFNVMPFMGRLKQWIRQYKKDNGLTFELPLLGSGPVISKGTTISNCHNNDDGIIEEERGRRGRGGERGGGGGGKWGGGMVVPTLVGEQQPLKEASEPIKVPPPIEVEPNCRLLLNRIKNHLSPLDSFKLDLKSLGRVFMTSYNNSSRRNVNGSSLVDF